MFVRPKSIVIVASATLLFFAIGIGFDRSLFRFVIVGHGKYQAEERDLITAAVSTYNAIFADFYASNGIAKMLNEFPATKAVRHGLFRDIGFIRDSGRILVYDLATLTPVDVRVHSHSKAEAVFFEEWNYIYQDKKDRKPVSPVKGMGQGYKYSLVKEFGAWKVSAWRPIAVEEAGSAGVSQ
jgi:hypothetical protein